MADGSQSRDSHRPLHVGRGDYATGYTRLLYFYNLVFNSSLRNCVGVGIPGRWLAMHVTHVERTRRLRQFSAITRCYSSVLRE